MIQENTRDIALDMLIDIMENNRFSHIVMREKLNSIEEKQDRSFVTRLVMGSVEKIITLDYIIEAYSNIKVKKMKPMIRNLLRMSVYQIFFMESVPDSAVCNEAVKIAKKRKFKGLTGFINGVLRNISRNKSTFKFPECNSAYGISVNYSCPLWICDKLIRDYDIDDCIRILTDKEDKAYTTVRVNTSLADTDSVTESLKSQGIEVLPGKYCSSALILKNVDSIENIEAFKNGKIQPQDESSMIVGMVASPCKGDYVVDICSAPGGKSLHIADMLNGTGFVDSRDVNDYKIGMINDNIARTGFRNIAAKVHDARITDKEIIGKADIVIADVPCSGLGVLNKKSDIKYKLTEKGMNELVGLQREILKASVDYLKPGGVLVYSTCTINPEENIENVRWLTENFDYRLETIEKYLPEKLQSDTAQKGYIQLRQGIDECDGFFIARLRNGKN